MQVHRISIVLLFANITECQKETKCSRPKTLYSIVASQKFQVLGVVVDVVVAGVVVGAGGVGVGTGGVVVGAFGVVVGAGSVVVGAFGVVVGAGSVVVVVGAGGVVIGVGKGVGVGPSPQSTPPT
jgi:hypothetical protein